MITDQTYEEAMHPEISNAFSKAFALGRQCGKTRLEDYILRGYVTFGDVPLGFCKAKITPAKEKPAKKRLTFEQISRGCERFR